MVILPGSRFERRDFVAHHGLSKPHATHDPRDPTDPTDPADHGGLECRTRMWPPHACDPRTARVAASVHHLMHVHITVLHTIGPSMSDPQLKFTPLNIPRLNVFVPVLLQLVGPWQKPHTLPQVPPYWPTVV